MEQLSGDCCRDLRDRLGVMRVRALEAGQAFIDGRELVVKPHEPGAHGLQARIEASLQLSEVDAVPAPDFTLRVTVAMFEVMSHGFRAMPP